MKAQERLEKSFSWAKQSQFIGVAYNETRNKWEVNREINGKTYYGGIFSSDVEAARASDELLRIHEGVGKLNFPDVTVTLSSIPKAKISGKKRR